MTDHKSKLLRVALLGGDVDAVETLLNSGFPQSELDGWLAHSVYYGRRELVKTFLIGRADPNTVGFYCGPLIFTAYHRRQKLILRDLILAGAKLDVFNEEGHTPLTLAAAQGNLAMVVELLDCGANVEFRCRAGKSALDHARECRRKYVTLVLHREAQHALRKAMPAIGDRHE